MHITLLPRKMHKRNSSVYKILLFPFERKSLSLSRPLEGILRFRSWAKVNLEQEAAEWSSQRLSPDTPVSELINLMIFNVMSDDDVSNVPCMLPCIWCQAFVSRSGHEIYIPFILPCIRGRAPWSRYVYYVNHREKCVITVRNVYYVTNPGRRILFGAAKKCTSLSVGVVFVYYIRRRDIRTLWSSEPEMYIYYGELRKKRLLYRVPRETYIMLNGV